MTIQDKIKKRIQSMQMLQGKIIKEIQITKKEAEQLGNIKDIDGVKLTIVDKLGDISNKDCFAYHKNNCYGLNKLYCKNRECKFYRKDITIEEIEKNIKLYKENRRHL